MSIVGADQGRDRPDEEPAVDDSGEEQGSHRHHPEQREAPRPLGDDGEPGAVRLAARHRKERGESDQAAQPETGGEKVDCIGGKMDGGGRRHRMAGPGKGYEAGGCNDGGRLEQPDLRARRPRPMKQKKTEGERDGEDKSDQHHLAEPRSPQHGAEDIAGGGLADGMAADRRRLQDEP